VQLDLLVDGHRQHLDLAARGMGSIGKASYGAVRSVRRRLVSSVFSCTQGRAPLSPRTRDSMLKSWSIGGTTGLMGMLEGVGHDKRSFYKNETHSIL
jgi:hypothetical protein